MNCNPVVGISDKTGTMLPSSFVVLPAVDVDVAVVVVVVGLSLFQPFCFAFRAPNTRLSLHRGRISLKVKKRRELMQVKLLFPLFWTYRSTSCRWIPTLVVSSWIFRARTRTRAAKVSLLTSTRQLFHRQRGQGTSFFHVLIKTRTVFFGLVEC